MPGRERGLHPHSFRRPGTNQRYPRDADERDYTVARCHVDLPQPGVADAPNICGTVFEERFNPSNTGNIRMNSRFTLADGLVLTVDPSFQYVKAKTAAAPPPPAKACAISTRRAAPLRPTACNTTPNSATNTCRAGYWGGSPFYGRDLNGDGDLLDTVTVLAPSQTQTRRVGLIAGLRWEINDDNTVRVAYTYDRGHHRQTGETASCRTTAGRSMSSRSTIRSPMPPRHSGEARPPSIALLNQIAGEYRGEFFDHRLTVNLGVRAPFFTPQSRPALRDVERERLRRVRQPTPTWPLMSC